MTWSSADRSSSSAAALAALAPSPLGRKVAGLRRACPSTARDECPVSLHLLARSIAHRCGSGNGNCRALQYAFEELLSLGAVSDSPHRIRSSALSIGPGRSAQRGLGNMPGASNRISGATIVSWCGERFRGRYRGRGSRHCLQYWRCAHLRFQGATQGKEASTRRANSNGWRRHRKRDTTVGRLRTSLMPSGSIQTT